MTFIIKIDKCYYAIHHKPHIDSQPGKWKKCTADVKKYILVFTFFKLQRLRSLSSQSNDIDFIYCHWLIKGFSDTELFIITLTIKTNWLFILIYIVSTENNAREDER